MPRVFFGQLPTDRAMEVLDWLLHLLKPSVPIFHIEAHTAKGKGGRGNRGKGCAWAYVPTVADAQELVALNHCALLTRSVRTGQLGAHVGNPAALELLRDKDETPSTDAQLLVAELPMVAVKRMKADDAPPPDDLAWSHDPYSFCPIPIGFRMVQ